MLMIVLSTILLILLVYIYVRWIRMKNYWAKRKVPYLLPHPLLGSMTFLQKENPVLWLRRLYDCFKSPYVGIWIFWRPALVINSTEIAKNILIKDQSNFRNRLASSGTTDPVGRLNLLMLKDPLWTSIRKRLSTNFTSYKLRGHQNLITAKSNELIERIEIERQKPKPIHIRSVMSDFTTDIIGTSAFGMVSDATLTGTSPLRSITEEFMRLDFFRGLACCSAFFIPELVDFFRFKVYPERSMKLMRKILRKIIAERGGFENKVIEPRDFLDILIKIKQEDDKELEMTEDMMLAQAAVFVQGGFDTSATALSFIIYELAYLPETQDKLHKELLQAKYKHGDKLLDATVLSQLTYLNCVINEGLRKYPIIGWLDRIALDDYKIDDHLTIKAGTPLLVNIVGMHYDPDFHPEPEKFNPDRFLPENEANIKPFTFLPFGEGPRNCIGQRFGMSTVRHGLTAVILSYNVEPLPNTPKPSDIKFEKHTVLVGPEDILSVEFIPRMN